MPTRAPTSPSCPRWVSLVNVVTKQSAVPSHAAIPAHRGDGTGPRIRTNLASTSRGAVDLLLVFGTVAMALGLAAVTASLTPSADAPGDPAQERRRIAIAGDAPEPWSGAASEEHARPPTTPIVRAGGPCPDAFPSISATGPAKSPLYPQNGVTLWDRIRVSSKRDRRAFLLGTAIQIHTPAIAATPGTRSAPPPCCPRT